MVEAPVLRDEASLDSEPHDDGAAVMQRPLRLLVLAPKPQGLSPGQRFRLEQWAPHVFERHGIRMDFVPYESRRLTELLYEPGHRLEKGFWVLVDFVRRGSHVARGRGYDAVVVYREAALIGPAIYERLLARMGTPMLFDFDDAIWLPTQISSVNGFFSRLHFWGKTATTCRLARGVFVGNSYLAGYARERNANVFVLPTSIDLEKYPILPEPPQDDPFVIGWSGSTHTLGHFEHARGPLEALAKRRRIVVKVICNRPPDRPIQGAENVFVKWSESGEAEAIGSAHVGIMPLPDNAYTRGKCGLKALQYMATGRPVVISPVGMNCDLVDSGRNGFLARSHSEWLDALGELAASRDLRRRVGAAARQTVEQGYSARIVAALFANAVRATVG